MGKLKKSETELSYCCLGKQKLSNLANNDLEKRLIKKYSHILPFNGKVYIFGTGRLGIFVKEQMDRNGVKINGFLNNNVSKHKERMDGLNIYPLSKADKEDIIIIGTIIHWHVIRRQLEKEQYKNFICYEELALLCNKNYPTYNQSFEGIFEKLYKNKQNYLALYDEFQDEKSLEVLDNIINFRMCMDTEHTNIAYQISIKDGSQYFDPSIMKCSEGEIFVDAGGFIGDSAEGFILWCKGNYKEILFYELDERVLKIAKENLKQYEDIVYIQAGLGKERQELFYSDMNEIGGGMISLDGDIPVEITALDERKEKVTFIKMDIEGFEKEALDGAKNTIIKWKPKLAISSYHKPEDLYEILLFIKKLQLNYIFYLRHYTDVYADTVLYAVMEEDE